MLGALQTKRLHPLGLPGSAAQLQNNQICWGWLGAAHGWGYLEFSRAGRLELLPYLKQEKVITPPAGTCQWLQARILNQTRTVRHWQVEAAKNTLVMSEIIPRDEQSSSHTPAAPSVTSSLSSSTLLLPIHPLGRKSLGLLSTQHLCQCSHRFRELAVKCNLAFFSAVF